MAIANSGRERILERIRKAEVPQNPAIDWAIVSSDQIFEPITDPLQHFLAECEANLTEVKVTRDGKSSQNALAELLSAVPAGTVYVQDDPRLRHLADAFVGREVIWSSAGRAPEDCQATVTLCEALVAQTGSIVSSSRDGGRGGSIIPPTHIVYATSTQIVPDITTALRNAMESDLKNASYFGLITGSSRTADIEKILVQGAHGPRKVAIVLEIQ
ncbi:MAG TPA: LUD domain-containing protein [Candidatus Koribacter sp.]